MVKPTENMAQRRYAPKSRGGCVTCRSRHVRCDQLRPRCSACKKSRRQCKYALESPESSEPAVRLVLWEPTEPKLTIRRLAHTPGQSPRECRALRYFRDVVAERLAGYFDASFWTRLTFQVAQTVGSLRHAMIALASHWENVVVPGMHKRSTADWECDKFTLQQYTLAVAELRESMEQASKPSTVELLISNLLFTCLEMFQNHYESALRQLSCGLYLFCEWHVNHGEAQAAEGGNGGAGDELEVQLGHIFKRLITQSLLFPVRRMDRRVLVPALTPKLPSVPERFETPDQARDSFNDCMGSIIHGVKSRHSPDPERCADGSNFLRKWSAVFADFRARADQNLSELERRNCIILEMQRLAVHLWALAASFASEMEFDSWLPDFSQLVALGSYIVNTKHLTVPQGRILHYPKFDIGMILPLYLVASRCRHPKLRRQAIDVLHNGPRQEGIWNSAMLASIAERVIEIEEKGLPEVRDCTDVPASARIKLEDATIFTADRKVVAIFVRQSIDGCQGAEMLHETISYPG
ncbi:Fungal Zn2-Cys6 binuclear cluster domain-containing protein [Cladophialophora immunda]|nr:Fungal Zn2-Cys6 binuclear cluster domain-containing protein [Cladophialophora immunda]